jgi:hypothetical protein
MCLREPQAFHRCFPDVHEARQRKDRKVPIKRFLFCALVLLFETQHSSVLAQTPTGVSEAPAPLGTPYDVASFSSELHRLSGVLDKNPSPKEQDALRDALPSAWTVVTPEHSYSVSTAPLREKLSARDVNATKFWLGHLAAETQSYSAAPATSLGNARSELAKILNEDEFAATHPPSPWQLFRQRVEDWVERMLLKMLGSMRRHPIGGQILFWLLMLAGVSFVAFWLFRFVTRYDHLNALPRPVFVAPSRSWQEWIRAAREAAARNEFREAVHAAYWAGIVRLEETGVLPRDRSKTPREYLRLASQPSPLGRAPNVAYREPLTALTTRLEKIWYANRDAGPEDFRDSLLQLEALGCPLE